MEQRQNILSTCKSFEFDFQKLKRYKYYNFPTTSMSIGFTEDLKGKLDKGYLVGDNLL